MLQILVKRKKTKCFRGILWPKLAATDKIKTLILFSLPRWRCQVEKRRMSFTAFKLLPRSFDHVQVIGDKLEVIYIMVVKNVSASVLKTSSGECASERHFSEKEMWACSIKTATHIRMVLRRFLRNVWSGNLPILSVSRFPIFP